MSMVLPPSATSELSTQALRAMGCHEQQSRQLLSSPVKPPRRYDIPSKETWQLYIRGMTTPPYHDRLLGSTKSGTPLGTWQYRGVPLLLELRRQDLVGQEEMPRSEAGDAENVLSKISMPRRTGEATRSKDHTSVVLSAVHSMYPCH